MSTERWYEFGYRLEDGTESWQQDYGSDGAWTSWDRDRGIAAIDMYPGSEVTSIYKALDQAGAKGVAIRREVVQSYGATEEMPRDTPKDDVA